MNWRFWQWFNLDIHVVGICACIAAAFSGPWWVYVGSLAGGLAVGVAIKVIKIKMGW